MMLIDGHNLISALPDLDLSDPDDEAKLVEKLRRYTARTGKRCVVIFDGGIPGGLSRELSTGPVQVVFAAAHHSNADRILQERIRNARDPGSVTVISSDHEVQDAAAARRMRVMSSAAFAALLSPAPQGGSSEEDGDRDPHLSEEDVETWLRLFNRRDEKGDGF